MLTKKQISKYLKKQDRRRNKDILKELFDKDPHCHYCGIETKWYTDIRSVEVWRHPYPSDMATLEHLHDFWNPEKRYSLENPNPTVVACWKCNNERSMEYIKSLDKEKRAILQGIMSQKPAGMSRIEWLYIINKWKRE